MSLKPSNPWYEEVTRLHSDPRSMGYDNVPSTSQDIPFCPPSGFSRHSRTPSPSMALQYHHNQIQPHSFEREDSRREPPPSYQMWRGRSPYLQESVHGPSHEASKPPLKSQEREFNEYSYSPSVSSNAAEEAEEDESAMLDKALDFAHHQDAPRPPAYTPRLMKPVAIPQVSPKMNSPFVRAYPEVLAAYNIRLEEFVEFIDNFNILMTGSPPLAALNTVGQVLGFVPNHWAQLAGGLTQVAAGVATYAVIKTRCARFLQSSNAEFFEPRGLKVQVKSTEEMAKICGVTVEDVMVQPLNPEEDMTGIGPLSRRLKAVEGYVAPLLLDMPPPAEQTSVLARLSQKQSEATRKKMEKKTMKDRQKALEKADGGEGRNRRDRKEERKADRKDKRLNNKAAKVDAKAEKEMHKATKEKPGKRDEKLDKLERKCQEELAKIHEEHEILAERAHRESKKDHRGTRRDKEIKASKKGLWIMVRNVDEARADEAEDERRKADSPFARLSVSRPNP